MVIFVQRCINVFPKFLTFCLLDSTSLVFQGPVSSREENGSVASSASLSSGTLQSGVTDDRLEESSAANIEPRRFEPSAVNL